MGLCPWRSSSLLGSVLTGHEVLGLDVGDSEDETFWRGFLTTLKQRGLTGVRLGHQRPALRTREGP